MTRDDAEQYAKTAVATGLGEAWGDLLWRFPTPNGSIDVHGADEDEARAALAEALADDDG